MVAADTTTLVAFLADSQGEDIEALDHALGNRCLLLPPVLLSEILSDPKLTDSAHQIFLQIPLLTLHPGFWERAGRNRSKIISKGVRARLADTLISQSCIDNKVALITRDKDFRHFAKHCGLKLVLT